MNIFKNYLVAACLVLTTLTLSSQAQTTITYSDSDNDATNYDTSAPNDPTTLSITSGSAVQSGALSGSGDVIKQGTGTLTLTGNNTYTGGTTVRNGTLVLDGAGAAINHTSSNTTVGSASGDNAIFRVSGGATGSDDQLRIGLDAGSMGKFTVTGAGSSWTTADDGTGILAIGSGGNGTLEVLDGATFTAKQYIDIAQFPGSSGSILVDGSGSQLIATGTLSSLNVGFSGNGSLTIQNGGLVDRGTNGQGVRLGSIAGSSGQLNLNSGGTLQALYIASGSGTGNTLNFNGGTFRMTAGRNGIISGFDPGSIQLLAGGGTIDTQSFSGILSNVLQGVGGLTINGTGTFTLTGNNTYTGGTTLSAGTLQIGNGGSTGTLGSGNVTNNSNITFNRSNDMSVSNAISGTGSLTKEGAGTLILTGNNTYTGGTIISSGILQVGDGGTTGSFTTGINNHATLVFNRSDDLTFGGSISDTGSLIKRGAGILTLTANNTYSGGTNVAEGTLSLQHNNAAGTGTIFTTGSVIDYGDGITVSNPIVINSNTTQLQVTTGKSATQSGIISETGGARPLEKIGDGTLTLSGNNTYSGGTTLSAGTLRIGHNNALGTGTLTIEDGTTLTAASGTRTLVNNLLINGDFTLTAPTGGSQFTFNGNTNLGGATRILTIGATALSNTFNGPISNGGLTIAAAAEFVTFSGSSANTYTGLTTVASGRLDLKKDAGVTAILGDLIIDSGAEVFQFTSNQIADTSTLTVNGRFDLRGSSETIQTLMGSGAVDYSSGFLDGSLSTQSGNFSGTISDPDIGVIDRKLTLNKIGTGTLTLSGNNSHGGGTDLQGGTLNVGHNNALGSGTLTIEDGTELNTSGGPRTLSNHLLVKGDFALNPDVPIGNRFQLNGDINLDGSVREISVFGNQEHVITGTVSNGGLTKAGSGKIGFFGNVANTYTGLTTVKSGSLILGGTTGVIAIAGDVIIESGATMQSRISNRIADTSTLTVNGQYDLDGASETIQTLMGSGQIRYSSTFPGIAGSLSAQSGNFSGTISQAGGTSFALNKIGTGTLTLSGNNTYSDGTEINGGTLLVNNVAGSGTGTGVVNVNNGGTLGGSGTITGNVNVNNGGTIAPGNSTGILTVGNLTLNAGSTTRMEINGTTPGTEHDQIVVAGTANLAGTLNLLFGFTPSNGDTFTLIDAALITGNFDAVLNSLGNALVYEALISDDYVLSITAVQTSFTNPLFTGSDPDLIAIAEVLDDNFADPDLLPIINALNSLPGTSLEDAFELINPDELTALTGLTFANARNAFFRLGNRLAELRNGATGISTRGFSLYDASGEFRANSLLASAAPTAPPGLQIMEPAIQDDPNLGMFVSGSGTFGDYDGDANGPGYDYDAAAVLAGVDYRVLDNAAVMAYGGYDRTDANLGNNGGTADADTARFGVAATWWAPVPQEAFYGLVGKREDRVYAEAKVGGAHHWYDTDRNGFGGVASGDTTGTELTAGGTLGYEVRTGNWTFGPEASLDYTHLWTNGFNETGSLAPLTIADDTSESLTTTLGGRIAYTLDLEPFTLSPYLHAGWRHEYYDTSGSATARFASGAGGFFSVRGPSAARDSIIGSAGISARYGDWLSLNLGYYGEGSVDTEIHNLNGSVTVWF